MLLNGLVSVIVPAHNAEITVDETLKSIRNQTYCNLEIVVVDDGSTDGTVDIVRRHAGEDPRIRILSITNSGVAIARNTGIAASRGEFVAPIDADDLWHPEKIARQMAVMRDAGPETGYVYTLYRRIDPEGGVLWSGEARIVEGHVYLLALSTNFVGNGSSLLIRRAALDDVGGYEPDLHRRGAQGCEDYLIQILMARFWAVGVVPEYLTGWRDSPGSMSSDWERMARSHLLMFEHVARRFPETPPQVLAMAEAAVRTRLAVQLLRRLRPARAVAELRRAVALAPIYSIYDTGVQAWHIGLDILKSRIARFRPARASPKAAYLACDPAAGRQPVSAPLFGWRLAALARRNEGFFSVQSRQMRCDCPRRSEPRRSWRTFLND
jgi:hypothetical protein